jgi:hypothetical protein
VACSAPSVVRVYKSQVLNLRCSDKQPLRTHACHTSRPAVAVVRNPSGVTAYAAAFSSCWLLEQSYTPHYHNLYGSVCDLMPAERHKLYSLMLQANRSADGTCT